jgi:hypothetical protein
MILGEDGRREDNEDRNERTGAQNEHDKDSGKFLEESGVCFECGRGSAQRDGGRRSGEKSCQQIEETGGHGVPSYISACTIHLQSRVMGGLGKEASVVEITRRTGHLWPRFANNSQEVPNQVCPLIRRSAEEATKRKRILPALKVGGVYISRREKRLGRIDDEEVSASCASCLIEA